MPQIIPIKDMRNTSKLSEMCHATQEPIFVTKNGYGDMVVLSMESYENILARTRVYDEVIKGKDQADHGDVLNGSDVMAALREKYGKTIST